MADPISRGDRLARAKSVFEAILALDRSRREHALAERCGDDQELRRFVERLITNHDDVESFLERPAVAAAETATSDANATRVSDGDSELDADLAGRVISHYRIERRLGAGGMGEVYLAHDLALGRAAALKLLPPGFHASIRDRLLREAWASAKVQHPAIATFYEAGRSSGVDFIAMEYVRGRSLREHLRHGPLPVEQATKVIGGLLEALVHAHFSGILHRDIKPENIMLTGEGQAKLLDFGLATGVLMEGPVGDESNAAEGGSPIAADEIDDAVTSVGDDETRLAPPSNTPDAVIGLSGVENLTRAGAIMGTPGYMAPEQLRGEKADERADVFAVGAVLYEMLAGKRAFPGKSTHDRFRSILKHDPDPLSNSGISTELSEIVARALAKGRPDRFPSASAFLKEIRRVSSDDVTSTVGRTIAAIDFENRSGDGSKDWLESELPDALGSGLAGIPGVHAIPREKIAKLIPRDQSLSEVEIGLRLGCSSVLSGGFEIEGSTISARARLTDVATGEVHEHTLSGPLQDIFVLRDQLVTVVAAQVNVEPPKLGGSAPKLEAYECYGRARRIAMTAQRAAMEQAVELLERAVSLEPGYAGALAALANAYAMRYHFTSDETTIAKAIDYGRRSVAADGSLAEAHLWLGYALYNAQENLEGFRELREAIHLDPTSFLAHYFVASPFQFLTSPDELPRLLEEEGGKRPADIHVWRRREIIRHYQRAAQLNPMFAWAWTGLGGAHLELAHFAEAVTCLRKAVALEPTAVPPISGVEGYLGECLRRRGDHNQAREHFVAGLEKLEKTDHMYRDTWRGLFLCGLGRNALDQNDERAALAAFNQASLHLRGRPARCGGHVLVQALSGMTRAGGGPQPFEEALQLHEGREGFDFTQVWGGTEDVDLLELSRAAGIVGRTQLSGELFQSALDWGSGEARLERSRQMAERD